MTANLLPVAAAPSNTTAVPADQIAEFRRRFRTAVEAARPAPAALRWRLGLFERGLKLADELEARIGPLTGRHVLDVGAAYGGDVAALCARGATCVAADKFDHDYDRLLSCLNAGPRLSFMLFDCTQPWPLPSHSFDIVMSMSVLELIDDLDAFFTELLRVLKPEGIAVIDTGPVLRMARLDPLYKLPAIALLPTPLRRWVAHHLFRRQYRFHVSNHTFYSAAKFKRYVRRHGFDVIPCKYADSPIMARAARWPLSGLWQFLLRWLVYDFVVLRRQSAGGTAGAALQPQQPA